MPVPVATTVDTHASTAAAATTTTTTTATAAAAAVTSGAVGLVQVAAAVCCSAREILLLRSRVALRNEASPIAFEFRHHRGALQRGASRITRLPVLQV